MIKLQNCRIAIKRKRSTRSMKQNSKKKSGTCANILPLVDSNCRSCSHGDTKKTKFLKNLLFLARIYKIIGIKKKVKQGILWELASNN